MSFYLPIPTGEMQLATMLEAVEERLEFYQHLYSDDIQKELAEFETLSPFGSAKDAFSHYFLRLQTYQNERLRRAFSKIEVRLMELRLSNYTAIELKRFLKSLRCEAQDMLVARRKSLSKAKEKTCLECVRVSLSLLRQGALEHAFKVHENDELCEDCDNYCIQMDFETCLDLTASTKYYIHNRKVYVYNFQWKQLIIALYKTYLINTVKEVKANKSCKKILAHYSISHVLTNVSEQLSWAFPGPGSANSGSFSQSNVDKAFTDFPPCMRRLYDVLQRDKRLGHQARFNFSLFLKDIGLSLEDQLSYWEDIYMKDPGEDAKCAHTWEHDNKRYIYSIRHIYGLEGSKLESFIKPCVDIEDIKLVVNEEGGCPFSHDDDHNLKKLLKKYLPNNSEDIEVMIHERKTSAQKGCQAYFKALMRKEYNCRVSDDEINFQNPAQFYLLTDKLAAQNEENNDFFESSSSSDEEAFDSSSSSSDSEANNEDAFSSSSSFEEIISVHGSNSSSDNEDVFSSSSCFSEKIILVHGSSSSYDEEI